MFNSKLQKIIQNTKEVEIITGSRLGTITGLDMENDLILVDFDDNPVEKPISAKLGTAWISVDDLIQNIDCVDTVKLDFVDGNPRNPVIRDVYYSLSAINRQKSDIISDSKLEIDADEILIRAKTRIVLECGKAKTVFQAEGNEIVAEADQIDSSANKNNKIKGGRIHLN